ncbi:MAG: flavodoxin-dependent (E)-4-hydroxy-3-methylbut-2-enyl-diphosphate synthase [Armatimonadetes bacterium]|nr:flavodoxin-dependent (E)-4-hydroxy-3-methylbut-2-enyl-diphosphate synthase [Armatimonadota bacterium]
MQRLSTRQVRVGGVLIGGGAPVSVQSMTNTPTTDVDATVAQIHRLERAGCDVVRVAVPDRAAAECLGRIKERIHIPLVADIHFDHRLALQAINQGVDKLRLNPGNIKDPEKIKLIADKAGERGIPIRIGVNAGSLDRKRYGNPTAEALVQSALDEIELLDSRDFSNIVISLKSFDVPTTIEAYRLISQKVDYPLHLGITEAGLLRQGTIRSAVGIGALLAEGIGDTLRVSLTADPIEEVTVGIEILKSLNLREHGFTLISCPTCARCGIDLVDVVVEVERRLAEMDDLPPIRVAVMGCEVNGPGEAKDADVGLAASKDGAVIFAEGRALRKVSAEDMANELMAEVRRFALGRSSGVLE